MVHADSRQIPRAWRYSGVSSHSIAYTWYRTITFYGSAFHLILLTARLLRHYGISRMKSHNPVPATLPAWHRYGLGLSQFARRYLGNRFYFLFLLLLRCFSSQAYHSRACSSSMRVAPFGDSGVIDYVHLGLTYRSLSRPSSAVIAQASSVCS